MYSEILKWPFFASSNEGNGKKKIKKKEKKRMLQRGKNVKIS